VEERQSRWLGEERLKLGRIDSVPDSRQGARHLPRTHLMPHRRWELHYVFSLQPRLGFCKEWLPLFGRNKTSRPTQVASPTSQRTTVHLLLSCHFRVTMADRRGRSSRTPSLPLHGPRSHSHPFPSTSYPWITARTQQSPRPGAT
jgi:hypothetical protein